jgi:hypothetical protein
MNSAQELQVTPNFNIRSHTVLVGFISSPCWVMLQLQSNFAVIPVQEEHEVSKNTLQSGESRLTESGEQASYTSISRGS